MARSYLIKKIAVGLHLKLYLYAEQYHVPMFFLSCRMNEAIPRRNHFVRGVSSKSALTWQTFRLINLHNGKFLHMSSK